MSEYQITSWKEIPSMITVRDGDKVVKSSLPMRFQEAIDELAMRQKDRKSTRLNSSHSQQSRMPSSA